MVEKQICLKDHQLSLEHSTNDHLHKGLNPDTAQHPEKLGRKSSAKRPASVAQSRLLINCTGD